MKALGGITLSQVQQVYGGAEGDLWELVMGEHIHIGGLASSVELAAAAGIMPGASGVDLCCCNGAGMRFLCRQAGVRSMVGVDATEAVVSRGRERCARQKLDHRIRFHLADVCATGLPSGCADFAWGEDAWCYVADKPALIAEAARLVGPAGTVAFTDWMEGKGLADAEAERFMRFMKFPSLLTLDDYAALLEGQGFTVTVKRDTGRFAPYAALYLDMLTRQLAGDALRIIGYDETLMQSLGAELENARRLAEQGKIAQGMIVARRKEG